MLRQAPWPARQPQRGIPTQPDAAGVRDGFDQRLHLNEVWMLGIIGAERTIGIGIGLQRICAHRHRLTHAHGPTVDAPFILRQTGWPRRTAPVTGLDARILAPPR